MYGYPSLTAIKNGIMRKLAEDAPVHVPANPAQGDAVNDAEADEEILNWLYQAEEKCLSSADRVVPDVPFQGEEVILESFDAAIVDSDDEEITFQAIAAEARIEAQEKGLSVEEDEEWTKLSFKDAMPEVPDISEWEETAGQTGVVVDDAPQPGKKSYIEVDLDDLVTEPSMDLDDEKKEEELVFMDADDGLVEKDEEMDDPARGDPMPDAAYSLVTDPGEAKGSGGENVQDPRQIPNPKRIPDKKVDQEKEPAKKKEKKRGEANREVEPAEPRPEVPLNQLDPTLFMNAQDRAWLEPENMVGVRKVRSDYGRYLAISKAMTSYPSGLEIVSWQAIP